MINVSLLLLHNDDDGQSRGDKGRNEEPVCAHTDPLESGMWSPIAGNQSQKIGIPIALLHTTLRQPLLCTPQKVARTFPSNANYTQLVVSFSGPSTHP